MKSILFALLFGILGFLGGQLVGLQNRINGPDQSVEAEMDGVLKRGGIGMTVGVVGGLLLGARLKPKTNADKE